MTVRYETVDVDGLNVFYRLAGDPSAPAVLLLHGFPSASHMFRDLIPELAGKYRVIALDMPGFGMTEQPARDAFAYTFDHIAEVVGRFTEVIGLQRFAIYVFDYGAPVGFRLALAHPERITAIVSQNGNTYLEGVSDAFAPVQAYWNEPTQANRDALRGFLTPQTTLFQYTHGISDPALVSPDGRNLDDFYLARPGNDEIQLNLLADYKTNVALYGDIQAYLRDKQPPVLAIWGKNDPFFVPPGAEALQAGCSGRRNPLRRERPFRPGDPRPRDRRGHARVPRQAPALIPTTAAPPPRGGRLCLPLEAAERRPRPDRG